MTKRNNRHGAGEVGGSVEERPYPSLVGCDSSGLFRLASCRLGSTCEGLLNYGHELLCIDRLVESELSAHRLGDLELARSGARHDDNGRPGGVISKDRDELETMDVGHLKIRNDEIDFLRPELPECLIAARRGAHLMTVSLQNSLLEQAFRFLVIDDEYVSHDHGLRVRAPGAASRHCSAEATNVPCAMHLPRVRRRSITSSGRVLPNKETVLTRWAVWSRITRLAPRHPGRAL